MQLEQNLEQDLNLVFDLECRVYHIQFYDLSAKHSLLNERYVAIIHPRLVRRFAIAASKEVCGSKPTITEVGEMITVEGQGKRFTCYPIGQTINTVVLPNHMLDLHIGTNVAREF